MALVKRLYRCDECGFEFHHHHASKNEPALNDCPECTAAAARHDVEREHAEGEERIARMIESGVPPAVSSVKGQAMKMAETMMSEMGHTDFNDGGRAGDRAAKAPPPMQTAEIHEMTRAMVEAKQVTEAEASTFADGARSFWQAGSQQTAPKLQQHINASAGAAAAARREGVDPIQLFHEAGKAGAMKINHEVVAAVKG